MTTFQPSGQSPRDFKPGDYVKVAPHTDSFMQGFVYGTVLAVGRKWITVEWSMNAKVKRKFAPDTLIRRSPIDGQWFVD